MSLTLFIAVATFHCAVGSKQILVLLSTFVYNCTIFVPYFAILVLSLNYGNNTSFLVVRPLFS